MKLSVDEKRRLIARLKRAEGQLTAVRRLVEEDAYCVDVLTQLAAVRGALGGAGAVILRGHVEGCVSEAIRSGDEDQQSEKVDELMDVFARYGGLGRR